LVTLSAKDIGVRRKGNPGSTLVINVLLKEVGFEDVRAFIVEGLEVGPGAAMDEEAVQLDVGS